MHKPTSKVMVTGSAGLVGQHTLRSLAIRRCSVVSLYRSKIPESMENVFSYCHDLRGHEGLSTALMGVDTVVHLAWEGGIAGLGDSMESKKSDDSVISPNIVMIENLLKAMDSAGTRRIVFVSALGASPKSDSRFLQEKYIAEHLILNSKIEEKIILRSTIVWSGRGESDPFLRTIIRLLKYPFYPLPSKSPFISPIHARDLARIIAESAICSVKDPAGLVEVRGSEAMSLVDVCKIVSDKFVGKPRFPIKGPIAHALLPFVERDSSPTIKAPKISSFLAITGSLGQAVATANPLKELVDGNFASFRDHVAEP